MERSADNRLRTTEWEDIQYKHGNKVGKYETQELNILAQRIADKNQNTCLEAYDPTKEKVQAKLERGGYEVKDGTEESADVIEDSDDDDEALAVIRRRRIAELQKQKETNCFGVLRHVSGSDYVEEVTNASEKRWVVAVLMKPAHGDCEALLNVMRVVASRHKDVKFVSMISTEAIPNFPDRHLPCVLLYQNKSLHNQITGMDAWTQSKQFDMKSVEKVLSREGVLRRDDEECEED